MLWRNLQQSSRSRISLPRSSANIGEPQKMSPKLLALAIKFTPSTSHAPTKSFFFACSLNCKSWKNWKMLVAANL